VTLGLALTIRQERRVHGRVLPKLFTLHLALIVRAAVGCAVGFVIEGEGEGSLGRPPPFLYLLLLLPKQILHIKNKSSMRGAEKGIFSLGRETIEQQNLLELIRTRSLPRFGFLQFLAFELKVFDLDVTDRAVLKRVLRIIILSDEAMCRGTSFLGLVDELLFLTLVFLILLLEEGVLTTPLRYVIVL
jgi:hypothetical protein